MPELKPRLDMILKSVPEGASVADIGTDHAFLPIALVKSGRARRVLACDISEGPLKVAAKNVEKSNTPNIELRLSDGLCEIRPDEVDTVVIAGMGGDLICDILAPCDWLRDANKKIILQPMTSTDAVRKFLAENGFGILSERAVEDTGRVYSVICAEFSGKIRKPSPAELFVGRLGDNPDTAAKRYIKLQYRRVSGCADSLKTVVEKQKEFAFWREAERQLGEIIGKIDIEV